MQNKIVEMAVTDAREMLEQGVANHKILSHLVNAAEEVIGDNSVCSILLLDKEGLLRNGASPRLPFDYLTAIDGLKPHPNVGTCAAAAATGAMVITPDFHADDKWAELRHLPIALGFHSAWSIPIKSDTGKVLGTFGTYFRDKKSPSTKNIEAVKSLASEAAHILNESKAV